MRDTRTRWRSPFNWLLILLLLVAVAYIVVSSLGGMDGIKDVLKELFDDYERPKAVGTDDNGIRKALDELEDKNPEASAFVDAYLGIEDYDFGLDLSSEIKAGTIPYFTQWDSRWGYCLYGEGLIGYTGCGPTALSMVAMGLTGDGAMTPGYIAAFATREGYCVPGSVAPFFRGG